MSDTCQRVELQRLASGNIQHARFAAEVRKSDAIPTLKTLSWYIIVCSWCVLLCCVLLMSVVLVCCYCMCRWFYPLLAYLPVYCPTKEVPPPPACSQVNRSSHLYAHTSFWPSASQPTSLPSYLPAHTHDNTWAYTWTSDMYISVFYKDVCLVCRVFLRGLLI